jgi:hypothetical protein
VMAANRRSVPTATAGLNPNRKTSNGVISEPPPTPVKPTNNPTKSPETVYAQFIKTNLCFNASKKPCIITGEQFYFLRVVVLRLLDNETRIKSLNARLFIIWFLLLSAHSMVLKSARVICCKDKWRRRNPLYGKLAFRSNPDN